MNAHDGPPVSLPPRPRDGHKGTFGRVLVVGGCVDGPQRMIGAPALVARGAFRAGAGLVTLACPEPIAAACVGLEPSAIGLALRCTSSGSLDVPACSEQLARPAASADAVVIGPGMGRGAETAALSASMLATSRAPVVVDADALVSCAEGGADSFARPEGCTTVLTPHPGEFRSIATALRVCGDPTDESRRAGLARSLAQALGAGAVVVLKGHRTVVATAEADWTCPRGHPCMGTAGTGDVLAGAVAGVLAGVHAAQSMSVFDACRAAVWCHAVAGERWAETHNASGGMLARELADGLPEALESCRPRA